MAPWLQTGGWGYKVNHTSNENKTFLAVWADTMMKAAVFMTANKLYNQAEITTKIMQRVEWATKRGVLPVHVEEDTLHEHIGKFVIVLGRIPDESVPAPASQKDRKIAAAFKAWIKKFKEKQPTATESKKTFHSLFNNKEKEAH